MPISNPSPNPKDVVIIQRSNDNSSYGEIHISGSNLILYTDANGYINADKSASFYSSYPPVNTGVTATFHFVSASVVPTSVTTMSFRNGLLILAASGT